MCLEEIMLSKSVEEGKMLLSLYVSDFILAKY